MQQRELTPADGWVEIGPVDALMICQVDPRVTSAHTPAAEVRRAENRPPETDQGVVQLGGWSVSAVNVDALGAGSILYARAIAARVRLLVESV
jgi:hypothetical protein